jgi:hypothetical protein
MPFDGLVEVGGALGPSFEAQAVNLSEEGIHLRTAYLPELGQPLTCRFDGGASKSVLVAGEVVWSQGQAKGGEFGVRFTEMDSESVDTLRRICGVGASPQLVQAGSKVRLHIEGLASPMRAKIKDSHPTEVTVGSELGFLQVGKHLELEDAQNGGKRPACIDRVEVAVDPTSNVPQLVVTLRYADVAAQGDSARGAASAADASPAVARPSDDLAAVEEASKLMKGALARNIARIVPALERFARRAKTTVGLVAQRRAERVDDAGVRRTTAMPAGGGLHASGRRVVRGESSPNLQDSKPAPKLQLTKRKTLVASAVMTAAIAGAFVLKKAHHENEGAAAGVSTSPAASVAEPVTAASTGSASAAVAPQPADPAPAPATPSPGAMAVADDGTDSSQGASHKKHSRVAPFGNGPVHHGNVLHLKMDGAIESIEGAQQPTGFAVKIPGRKSVDAAAPLAARDSRIAAIKVSNDPAGAELTVAFKDGVPNYLVSAKGDTLVISLAPVGSPEKLAKKDDKSAKSSKRGKHER